MPESVRAIGSRSESANRLYAQARGAEIDAVLSSTKSERDEQLGRMLRKFQDAIKADSGFAAAYWGLGDYYGLLFVESARLQDLNLMKQNYEKAYALAPDLAGANVGLGWARFYDERLDEALKGMDDRSALYHYATKVSHLLVGPFGIWVLLPRMVNGKVYWEKGRYRNRVKGAFKNYLRLFGQDSMGRPELELGADIEAIRDYLKKKLPEAELPEVQGAFVVLNEMVEIEAEEAPYATVTAKKLKDAIRKNPKQAGLAQNKIEAVKEALK